MRDRKNFVFYNIIPCTPGKEDIQAQDAIELEKRTGISIALYCLTLHPEGFPASKKAEYLTESYRKFRHALQGSRVRPGILIQSIIGHWPRVDKKEEQWTRTVDINGRTPRFCTLDPDYRKYVWNTVCALAKEKPCFIMTDDDVRMFSPDSECFCKLHTEEFNKRTGHHFTPEEFRLAVRNCKVGDEIYTAFEKLRRDTIKELCAFIRKAIDSVDPSIPAATCMPEWGECRFNKEAALAIAAKGQTPVMRMSSAMYLNMNPIALAGNHLHSEAIRIYQKEIPCVLDEADTFPHSLYSMPAVMFHAKLCSGMFAGATGAKIWFVNAHKGSRPVNRKYTDILAKYRNFDQILAGTIRETSADGLIIPVHDRFIKWHPAGEYREKFLPEQNWCVQLAGLYGVPFRADFDLNQNGIYAVAGSNAIDRFTDEQLRQLMTRKVLLDGQAAIALTKRGFAPDMGVSAELKEFRYNSEFSADGKKGYSISKNPDVPFLKVLNKNAKVLTNLCYQPFSTSPERETVAPGTVLFKNKSGGIICTAAFGQYVSFSWQNDSRKEWLLAVLDALNGKRMPYVIAENHPAMLLHRTFSGNADLLGVFNLSPDPMETTALRCGEKPENFQCLTPAGRWKNISFDWNNGVALLPVRLECNEVAVLKITRHKCPAKK